MSLIKRYSCWVGLVSGLLLLALSMVDAHMAIHPALYTFLVLFIAVRGVIVCCCDTGLARMRIFYWSLIISAVIACVGTYGYYAGSYGTINAVVTGFILMSALRIAHQYEGWRLTLNDYLSALWETFSIILINLIFVLLCWAILAFWALFFDVIQMDIFEMVFFSTPFILFITPILSGIGFAFANNNSKIRESVTEICVTISRLLLPILALIIVLYLFALLFNTFVLDMGIRVHQGTLFLLPIFSFLGLMFLSATFRAEGDLPIKRWYLTTIKILSVSIALVMIISLLHYFSEFTLTQSGVARLVATVFLTLYSVLNAFSLLIYGRRGLLRAAGPNLLLGFLFIVTTLVTQNFAMTMVLPQLSYSPMNIMEPGPVIIQPFMPVVNRRLGIEWVPPGDARAAQKTIMGYAYQQPIYVCRANVMHSVSPGELRNGVCYITYHYRRVPVTHYQVLVVSHPIQWRKADAVYRLYRQHWPIVGGHERDGSLLYVCRTIVDNEIHLGKVVTGACDVSINDKEVRSPAYGIPFVPKSGRY